MYPVEDLPVTMQDANPESWKAVILTAIHLGVGRSLRKFFDFSP